MTAHPHAGEEPPLSMNDHRKRCALRRLQCFEDVPTDILDQLLPHIDVIAYCEGDTVIAPGHWDGAVLFGIVDGKALLTKARGAQGDIDVSHMAGGTIIGLVELLCHEADLLDTMSLVADTALDVVMVDASIILHLCAQDLALHPDDDDLLCPSGRAARSPRRIRRGARASGLSSNPHAGPPRG